MLAVRPLLALCLGVSALGCDMTPPAPPPPPGSTGGPVAPVALAPVGQNVPPVAPTAPGAAPGTAPSAPAGPVATMTLTQGFPPERARTEGQAGGPVDASTRAPGCRGYISETPSQMLVLEGELPVLRILVSAGGADTTLVVQKPDGSFVCDDDSDVRNPIVTLKPASGTYRVWVGAYGAGISTPYVLGYSEDPRAMSSALAEPTSVDAAAAAAAAAALDTRGSESNYGFISLSPGFEPDPHVSEGTSGAAQESTVDASALAKGCAGFITTRPDHIFIAAADFTNLAILARSEGDTALVVRRPDGSFMCDDDSAGGRNPGVHGSFPAGSYSIWVASYDHRANYRYRLGFSERPDITSDRL